GGYLDLSGEVVYREDDVLHAHLLRNPELVRVAVVIAFHGRVVDAHLGNERSRAYGSHGNLARLLREPNDAVEHRVRDEVRFAEDITQRLLQQVAPQPGLEAERAHVLRAKIRLVEIVRELAVLTERFLRGD